MNYEREPIETKEERQRRINMWERLARRTPEEVRALARKIVQESRYDDQ